MSKGKKSLQELAMEATTANIVKGRGASGRTTYLDRFVKTLLDEDGNPTEPQKRTAIIATITLAICVENSNDQIEQGVEGALPFGEQAVETEGCIFGDTDEASFKKIGNKVKNQVAAAIANSQNATSLSYNDKYKDVWVIVKGEGGVVSLQAK